MTGTKNHKSQQKKRRRLYRHIGRSGMPLHVYKMKKALAKLEGFSVAFLYGVCLLLAFATDGQVF